MKAESLNGSIEFLGNGVVLKTKGSAQTIPLNRIQGVEFKKCGLTAGHIRVNVAGADEPRAAIGPIRNRTQAKLVDRYSVVWSRAKLNSDFEAVADAINRALLA